MGMRAGERVIGLVNEATDSKPIATYKSELRRITCTIKAICHFVLKCSWMCLLLNFSHSIFTLLYKQFRVSWLVVFDSHWALVRSFHFVRFNPYTFCSMHSMHWKKKNTQTNWMLGASRFYVIFRKRILQARHPARLVFNARAMCVWHIMHARIQLIRVQNSHNSFGLVHVTFCVPTLYRPSERARAHERTLYEWQKSDKTKYNTNHSIALPNFVFAY